MKATEQIYNLAKENNGIVTSYMLAESGINRGNLKYMVDSGRLENVARGVYILPESWEDEFFNLQNRFKQGIYSLETALFLQDLTDRTPLRFSMTFPKGYNLTSVKKEDIHCVQNVRELYELGIIQLSTPAGNSVNCYNMEKTLCDILRPRMNVDIQVVADAYKRYMKRQDRNIPLLSEYAKKLQVENKVRSYLEVLL